MPRVPRRRGPGRRRKFKYGDIAYSEKHKSWVVVVDAKKYPGSGEFYYRVIRVMHRYNGAAYGKAVWAKGRKLRKPVEGEMDWNRTRKTVLSTYRANQRLEKIEGDRGCNCNCCVHTAIPRAQLTPDGRFKWELEMEGETDE